jgi:hypothetical protein
VADRRRTPSRPAGTDPGLNIVCPYTPAKLQAATAAALDRLDRLDRPVARVDVSGHHTAYAALLEGLWAAGEDFLIVEHDMVPTPAMVDQMESCQRWWCVNPYAANEWGTLVVCGFGFTRFRAGLMAAEPDAFAAAAAVGDRWSRRHWMGMDGRLVSVIADRGYRPHAHEPVIEHLHVYP